MKIHIISKYTTTNAGINTIYRNFATRKVQLHYHKQVLF
jgi:hypothetical protein